MSESDVIISSLGFGAENAVTADYLQKISGLDGRTLRLVIQEQRRMGLCVLSSIDGYFRPSLNTDQAYLECHKFNATMRARAVSSFETARITELYMRSLDHQIALENFDNIDLV